jgi:membrane dipeptidase
MKSHFPLFVVFLFGLALSLLAQLRPDGEQALKHVKYLAGPDFKGRKAGTAEYLKAAEYVAARMKDYGLLPGGEDGGYFQSVPLKDWRNFDPPTRLALTAPRTREYVPGRGRDFRPVAGTGSGKIEAGLAFAGYGLESAKSAWDDYAGISVKGRVVLVLSGVPDFLPEDETKDWTLGRKVKAAREHGAVGLIEMDLAGSEEPGLRRRTAFSVLPKDCCPPGFVVLRTGRSFCDDVFYAASDSWKSRVSRILRLRKPASVLLTARALLEAHFTLEDRRAPNVLGILPGTDPVLKAEALVLGAHLDHLGVGGDGAVYPGADDNASGVAVMLETARALQAAAFRPARTIVFAAWAGEEIGFRGSSWYVEHPVVPLDKTAAYFNLDMVGLPGTGLYVGGLSEFAEFAGLVRPFWDKDIQDSLHDRPAYRSSDHVSFLRKGVTSLSLRTGKPLTFGLDDEHPEYHAPGDRPEEIQAAALELAARCQVQALAGLADLKADLFDPDFHALFVHRDALVADLHCDTIGRALEGEDLGLDNDHGHIDIPKLKRGGVDLQVFACFVAAPRDEAAQSRAAKRAFDQIDAVHRLVAAHPRDLALVLSPEDIRGLPAAGRTGALIGIEGGYAIENDLSLLDAFYRSGVRLMTLTHWTHTDWADASGDPQPVFGGLTDFGKKVVAEMNRLGMIIDVSHAGDTTFWDVIKLTKAPVVASHSCCRALADYHRNLTDGMLKALAQNGGVVGINFAPGFLDAELMKRQEAIYTEVARRHGIPEGRMDWRDIDPKVREAAEAEIKVRMDELARTFPAPDVKSVVDHIEHVIKVTGGADYVGLGSDFDGISSTPVGLENAGLLPNITREMIRRGFQEEDIRKILGGNFVRVFEKVAEAAEKPAADGPGRPEPEHREDLP